MTLRLTIEEAREITAAGGDVPHGFIPSGRYEGPSHRRYALCKVCNGRLMYAAHDERLRPDGAEPSERRETRVPAPLGRPETDPHGSCVELAGGARGEGNDDSRDPREVGTYARKRVPEPRGNA